MTRAMGQIVQPEDMGVGFYVVFGSDLGLVGFVKVTNHATAGRTVWGLSRWRAQIAYRTLGLPVQAWLARQTAPVQIRRDADRTGWRL